MTIGPEPMTRTLSMSLRFGTSGHLSAGRAVPAGRVPRRHEVHEPVEQVRRIVRTGRGLRVVLHRERLERAGGVTKLEPLDHVVVEAHVAHARLAVRGRGARL